MEPMKLMTENGTWSGDARKIIKKIRTFVDDINEDHGAKYDQFQLYCLLMDIISDSMKREISFQCCRIRNEELYKKRNIDF